MTPEDQQEIPQEPPAPVGIDWSQYEDPGRYPDEAPQRVVDALQYYDHLVNPDPNYQRVAYEALGVVPLPDGMDYQQAYQFLAQQAQVDPFSQYEQPEPQYHGGYQQPLQQPQPQQFDPRMLQPVFDQYGQRIKQEVLSEMEQRQRQFATQQEVVSTMERLRQANNLTDQDMRMLSYEVNAAMQAGMPVTRAVDAAWQQLSAYRNAIASGMLQQHGPQTGNAAAPGAPAPGVQPPQSIRSAMDQVFGR